MSSLRKTSIHESQTSLLRGRLETFLLPHIPRLRQQYFELGTSDSRQEQVIDRAAWKLITQRFIDQVLVLKPAIYDFSIRDEWIYLSDSSIHIPTIIEELIHKHRNTKTLNLMVFADSEEFSTYCAEVANTNGWEVSRQAVQDDSWRDLVLARDARRALLRCAYAAGSVSPMTASSLLPLVRGIGVREWALVTNTDFSPAAESAAHQSGTTTLHVSDLPRLFRLWDSAAQPTSQL